MAVEESTTRPHRWTPARIRKATLLPKPRGAIEKEQEHNAGGPRRELATIERRLLREIIDGADLLDVTTPDQSGRLTERWLLVRADPVLLDLLAIFEAEREDLAGDEREPDVDDEPGGDDEYPGDDEPSVVRPDTMSRMGLQDDFAAFPTLVEYQERHHARHGKPNADINDWQRKMKARDVGKPGDLPVFESIE